MKTVYSFLFSFFLVATASAQRVYFIYFEADKGTPFYVRMGDKIYSSSTGGYFTLSNLVDSTYSFQLGNPATKSESRFSVKISGRDRGFLIKDFDYGPGLFDMQTLSVIRPEADESRKNISYKARNDEFTTLLAKASNDSSLLLVPILAKQEVVVQTEEKKKKDEPPVVETTTLKPDTNVSVSSQSDVAANEKKSDVSSGKKEDTKPLLDLTVVKQEDVKTTDAPAIKADEKNVVVVPALQEEYKRSTVHKHSESSTSEGFGLVFYDKSESGTDTIQLIIPNPKIIFSANDNADTAVARQQVSSSEVKKDTITQVPIVVAVKDSRNGIIVNSQCKSIAAESDFFKLRKNMASKTSDDTMVDEAKKVFKSKCFSTEQIKNLGSLFLTSAGKYQFFDAAYLHVTDRDRFNSLQSEISDEYYLKRFKALVGE